MKTLRTEFLLVAGLCVSVLCTGALRAQDGYTAKLTAASKFATAGGSTELVLTLDVKKKSAIPASLLTGLALKTTIDGKPGPKISQRSSGRVTLVGGTRVERRIDVDLRRIAPNIKSDGVTRVSFEWIGVKGLSVILSVIPDLTKVAIEKLDLKKTQVLLVTNYGDLLLRFFPDEAPNHVANFIKLAKNGFYNGTKFHRVINGFMIQGGCPNTKKGATGRPGSGGPGYTVKAEFNKIRHVRGVLSMARTTDPNSAGCQFFIVHKDQPGLDGKYTAFGELVTGLEVLDKIANVKCAGPQGSAPVKPVHLKAAIVRPHFKQ